MESPAQIASAETIGRPRIDGGAAAEGRSVCTAASAGRARSARSAPARLPAAVLAAILSFCGGCGSGTDGDEARTLAEADLPRAVVPGAVQPRARVALVLSSGGLRGLAHLGVLRALEHHGMAPDLVVGSSVGAIVGVGYAAGWPSARILDRPLPEVLDPWGSWLVSPARRSRSLEAFVAVVVGGRRIEDLPRRFVAVATERNSGCLVLFDAGDAARAVTASSALPGALAPVSAGGRTFADGGLGAPLPVRVARALGAERVIAVDTTFHAEPEVPPGPIDSVLHAGLVMSRHLAQPDRDSADVLIEPRLPPVSEVTLANREQLVLAGERATLAQMERLRQLFAEDIPARRTGMPGAPGAAGATDTKAEKAEAPGAPSPLPMCDATSGRWADHARPRPRGDSAPAAAPPGP